MFNFFGNHETLKLGIEQTNQKKLGLGVFFHLSVPSAESSSVF